MCVDWGPTWTPIAREPHAEQQHLARKSRSKIPIVLGDIGYGHLSNMRRSQ